MKKPIHWACLLVPLFFVGCGPKADIVVSPCGEISSLSAAIARARELRAKGLVPEGRAVEVRVEPGRYHVAGTVTLSPEDSGLHFTGAGWRSTVFDGGVEIGPFDEGENGIWEASVPKGFVFEQLWVDDKRAVRARMPNEGRFNYMRDECAEAVHGSFFASRDDLAPLAGLTPEELSKVMVVYWLSWDMGCAAIRSIDKTTGRVTTARTQGWPFFYWKKTCPRYVFENFFAALDAPGEWFLDEKASKVYYLPRPGERLGETKAYAPKIDTILLLAGDAANGKHVKDVRFEGIGFECSRLAIGPNGVGSCQSAMNVTTAAVVAKGADGFELRNVRIAHTGAHGLWIREGSVRSRVEHSLIEDLGAGGVYLGDGEPELKRLERNSAFLTLTDSIVRHGGRILNGAVGVWLGQVNDCRVVHNEISDFLYTGVSMGWNWGYMETTTRRNHIDFNHIHHIQQGRLSDGGAVYTLGDQTGSTVCNNWIHDVNGYRDNGSPAWGLYTDEGSARILLASNLVERCRSGAIHQHYGTENTYANNIFATFDEFGVWRSRVEDHVTIRVTNNIFWWTNTAAACYTCKPSGVPADIPIDGNVYWCAAGQLTENAFNGVSWDRWRAGGKDASGTVADPLFVDPARGDWALRPESPALKAGFVPFDWRAAGVLKDDADWVALAAEATWDVFKDAPPAPVYVRESADFDCERLAVGVAGDSMARDLAPLDAAAGRAGAIKVTDLDPAQGKKSLEFTDLPNLRRSYMPMVSLDCTIRDGTAKIRFSLKCGKGSKVAVETRDVEEMRPFFTGTRLVFADGEVSANGKAFAKTPLDVWVDAEMAIFLDGPRKGEWTLSVAPRGGTRTEGTFRSFVDKDFSRLSWVGFISYGNENSRWFLDAVSLRKD